MMATTVLLRPSELAEEVAFGVAARGNCILENRRRGQDEVATIGGWLKWAS
jgi:hypothetical protein